MIVLAVFVSFHLNTYEFDSFPQKVDELRQVSQVKGDVDQLQRQGSDVQYSYRGKTSVLFQAFISCMKVYNVGGGSTSTAVAAKDNKVFVVFQYDRFSLNRPLNRKDPPNEEDDEEFKGNEDDNDTVASGLSQLVSYD